ncbi:MAG TPA: M12 family metallo-peptidase [Phycisphaerae bacterium]|nr:M12 family metallo-peptidase [Phycisphaerae bacterium]
MKSTSSCLRHALIRGLLTSCLGVALIASPAWGDVVSTERKASLATNVVNEFSLGEFSIQRLNLPEDGNRSATLSIQLDGVDRTISITPYRVFAPDYKLLVDHGDGRLEEAAIGEINTVRGTITDIPGSVIAGGLIDGGIVAKIKVAEDDIYWIEPLYGRVDGAEVQEHIIYRKDDALPHNGTCGTNEATMRAIDNFGIGGTRGSGCGGGVCVTDLACDADFEYFQDYGTVGNVQNRIASVINAMNVQYESQVGITHQISTIIVRTSPVYSSNNADTLLGQFRSQWLNNHTNIQRDIVHLFTGKNLVAPTIGIAWVGVICNDVTSGLGFGLVESDFNGNFSCATDLSAHELGHNWSASHCSCSGNTMNPSITCANNFSATFTIPGIISFRDSRTCLSPLESGTTTLPFSDDFPSTTLNPTNWTGINGAESNAEGNGEPSASNSLNIDGSDEIRSAIIDTSVPLGLDLSYYWQRTGSGNSPEAGEDLIVEYLSDSQLWVQLTSYPGDGPDGDPFAFDSFELPPDALHNSFRIRFRGISPNAGFDDWFIDDINIDPCYGATVSPQPQPAEGCPGTNLQFSTSGSGGEPIGYQWFKGDVMLVDGGGISGAETDTLTISGVIDPADEGDYHCEITNECGSLETNSAHLTVYDPAAITSQPPALVTACVGDTEFITVGTAGDELSYEWRKDGVLLTNGGNISGATTSSLQISNISLSDAVSSPGYVCTVLDTCGNVVDSSAAVLDIGGAEVTDQPEDDCVNDGESASFTTNYNVSGGFSTFVQWHKDGSPLVNGGNVSGAFTNTLTINPASAADVGGYSLRVLVIGPNCVQFTDEGQLSIGDCGCTLNSECDDGNPCTDDICDPELGCINPNNSAACDDGNACTTSDVCNAGSCVGSSPLVCDDSNACTDDTCDPGSGCVFTNNTNPCDDGDACTTSDVCDAGSCVGSSPLVCDDSNACTDDTCDPGSGCVFTNNTNPCDDGDACTTLDVCDGGSCVGSDPLDCDDGDFCNGVETCDSGSGCITGVAPCDGSSWCDEDGDACIAYGDGDINLDGSVDLLDYAAFQSCFGMSASGGCEALNLTGDGTIDLDDFAALEGVLTGP